MNEGDKVRLTLEALPGPSPPVNRLRQALKALLRSFGFRCLAVEEVKAPEEAGENEIPKNTPAPP